MDSFTKYNQLTESNVINMTLPFKFDVQGTNVDTKWPSYSVRVSLNNIELLWRSYRVNSEKKAIAAAKRELKEKF